MAPVDDAIAREQAAELQHLKIKATGPILAGYFARLEKQDRHQSGLVHGRDDREGNGGRLCGSAADARRNWSACRDSSRGHGQGAVGVSTSLEYAPAPYASTEELIALAKRPPSLAESMRRTCVSEQEGIMTALDEAFRIGREAHIPAEIWHMKAGSVRSGGMMPEMVARIESGARIGSGHCRRYLRLSGLGERDVGLHSTVGARGRKRKVVDGSKNPATGPLLKDSSRRPPLRIGTMNGTRCPEPEAILIPPWTNPSCARIQGQTLAAIAKTRGTDPIDTLFDILVEDDGKRSAVFGMQERTSDSGACRSPGYRFATTARYLAGRALGQGAPTSASLRHVPAVLAQVRARGASSPARGGDPQVHRAPASHCGSRSRGHQARALGGHRGVRSGPSPTLDLSGPNQLAAGHAVGVGERRAGDRRRLSHSRAAGPGLARAWISGASGRSLAHRRSVVGGIENASGKLSMRSGPL